MPEEIVHDHIGLDDQGPVVPILQSNLGMMINDPVIVERILVNVIAPDIIRIGTAPIKLKADVTVIVKEIAPEDGAAAPVVHTGRRPDEIGRRACISHVIAFEKHLPGQVRFAHRYSDAVTKLAIDIDLIVEVVVADDLAADVVSDDVMPAVVERAALNTVPKRQVGAGFVSEPEQRTVIVPARIAPPITEGAVHEQVAA